jgi:hypothetical protein
LASNHFSASSATNNLNAIYGSRTSSTIFAICAAHIFNLIDDALGYHTPKSATQFSMFNCSFNAILIAAQIRTSASRFTGFVYPHFSVRGAHDSQ